MWHTHLPISNRLRVRYTVAHDRKVGGAAKEEKPEFLIVGKSTVSRTLPKVEAVAKKRPIPKNYVGEKSDVQNSFKRSLRSD